MNKVWTAAACSLLLLAAGAMPSCAVELRIGRDALERTLKQQLFSNPNGRFYLKGTPRSACSVYAEDARVSFLQDRIVVKVKTRAHMGKSVGGACIGIALSPLAEVSMVPTEKASPSGSETPSSSASAISASSISCSLPSSAAKSPPA